MIRQSAKHNTAIAATATFQRLSGGERAAMLCAIWLVCVAYVCSATVADPDLWGHTLYGLRAIDQGVLVERADPFSYTAAGHTWINHEWLTEYQFGWLWRHFGSAGLWMWRNVLAVGVFAVAAWMWQRARASAAAGLVLLAFSAQCLSGFFLFVRPQLATFALFAWTLAILRRHWDLPSTRAIWLLPLLTGAWTNLHGGFLAGLGLQGLFVAGFAYRAWRRPADRSAAAALAIVFVTASLATLVNPYGFELHRMLWDHLVPEQAVREWQPLWAAWQAPMYYVPFLLLALALPWSKSWKWIDLAVLLVVGFQAVCHIRHVALLCIAALVLLPGPLTESLSRLFPALTTQCSGDRRRGVRWAALSAALAVLIALELPSVATFWQRGLQPWDIAAETRRDVPGVPLQAIDLIRREGLHGNLLTDYGWGQYVLWHLHPQIRVAFDGRYRTVYPADVERDFMAFQTLTENDTAPTPLLDDHATDFVLLPAARVSNRYLAARDDFALVLADEQASLYVRRTERFAELIARAEGGMMVKNARRDWVAFPAGPPAHDSTKPSLLTMSPVAGAADR